MVRKVEVKRNGKKIITFILSKRNFPDHKSSGEMLWGDEVRGRIKCNLFI